MFFQLPEVELCSVPPVKIPMPETKYRTQFGVSGSYADISTLGQDHKLPDIRTPLSDTDFQDRVGRRLSYVHRTQEYLPIRITGDHGGLI